MTCHMSRMGARHMGGYHIGFVLGHFGLCWDILGHVGQELGPYWAYLGPFWAMLGHFGPCWNHVGLILGRLGSFRICVGLCFGLGHFSVVDFSSMQGVCKKHQKYQEKLHQKKEKIEFVDYVADGFCCYFLVVFVSFLGHAAVGLCLPDLGLMLDIVGYVGTFWATLSHVEISSMQGVCKKKHKYQEQTQF